MESQDFATAYEYYRTIYKEIDEDDIKSFAERYRGSEDEEEDLIDFYERYEGDITTILEEIPCSENEDIPRFIKIYEDLIKWKEIKKT